MTVGSKVKQTLAGLKGIEGTLRVYSLQSTNKEEKQAFADSLKTIETIVKDMEDRVKTLEYKEPQYKGF